MKNEFLSELKQLLYRYDVTISSNDGKVNITMLDENDEEFFLMCNKNITKENIDVGSFDERFEKLGELVRKGYLREAKELINSDFNDVDRDYPRLIRYKMLIRTKEILAK